MADNPGDPVSQNTSANQGTIVADWTLFISAHNSPEHHHWSRDNTSIIWTMVVFWDDYVNLFNLSPVFNLLGYPQLQANGSLIRNLPMQHPSFPWLRASDLSVEFVIPNGKLDSPLGPVNSYEHVRISVTFTSPNFDIYTQEELDNLGLKEWDRFVVKVPSPINDIFQAGPNDFSWTNSNPANGSTGSLSIQPGYPIGKTRWEWTWIDVPDDLLMDSDNFPVNLAAAQNTVNNAAFAGRRTGTLLLENYKVTPHVAPVSPVLMFITDGSVSLDDIPRTWDVSLSFLYFDPPTLTSATVFGHNLAPDPKSTSTGANSSAPSGTILWAPIQTSATPPGMLLQSSDFTKIFSAVP